MNTTNGTLNIARLIEEAEAQLIGESNGESCTSCGNCKGGNANDTARCSDRDTRTSTRHLLMTAK